MFLIALKKRYDKLLVEVVVMKKNKKSFICFIIFLIIFIIFTALVKIVDVKAIGPVDSEVGFSTINEWFHNKLVYNDLFYKVSKYLGYISFLIIGFYALVGLKQLIERKNIFKVDKEVLVLGAFYILVLFVYFLFEKIIINYRPVLENGSLEASYPSSHTILSICVCLSSTLISKKIFKSKTFLTCINICAMFLMIAIIITRVLSGVHWLTDILGGLFISISLCSLFNCFIESDFCKEKL